MLAVISAVAVILTGCGASVTVYDYTSGGMRYNMYELELDSTVAASMERTAAVDADGTPYTVKGYFTEFFRGCGYEPVLASDNGKLVRLGFRKALSGDSELDKAGSVVAFETTYKENAFVRTYTAASPNPFNGVREAFDGVEPDVSTTALERLKNGIVTFDEYGGRHVSFLGIYDAFPYLKTQDPDGLLLSYVRTAARRMTSSGTTTEQTESYAEYKFDRYFDVSAAQIMFEYKRPVPYGWYLTALGVGATALAVMLIIVRAKEKSDKPDILDIFD